MLKVSAFLVCSGVFAAYSGWVYTSGTEVREVARAEIVSVGRGKALWQRHNCAACHQLFGLGGFLGPDLTRLISDPERGEARARVFLEHGGTGMPNFRFSAAEIEDVVAFLRDVDTSARSDEAGQ